MLSFFPLDVLDEILDLIESVFERFLTYLLFCVVRLGVVYQIIPFMPNELFYLDSSK